VVRGVVKRIVILKPDPKTGFEQAIFIVSDHERTGEDLVTEACRIAAACLQTPKSRRWHGKKVKFCFAGAGAVIFGVFMLIFHFIL
jgi:hypothetical protein